MAPSGSEAANEIWTELAANREAFHRFLSSRVRGEGEAQDILQESLLRALERGGSLREPGRAVAWFYQILRNAIADHHRGRAAEGRRKDEVARALRIEGEETASLDPPPTPCACVNRELATLRPAYAELLRRIDLGGEEPGRVARDLGITPANLAVRLHRARRALRTGIEHSCGPCAGEGCRDCTCGEPAAAGPGPG